ncbi:sigma 54-interacting transcriptional regulator [Clostridium botulinum]|uniref:sigma 54-interacting transcriptional regulator n=1 Tax=Clostridium botulinum TaxID=1491 RepID=UPI00030581ED|nr:sigma-54-dependent transcriptional regulator [Clostridium botulinum]KLU74821.1 PTS sugar transporter subunit IIA [Clostridium botulinum V891]KOA74678.1 PTS sugar transporter subunit IIA [Clostridium botulinum]KOA91582.1 PTS sugar transporter subunit IIA [Clostridium botulinum]KOC33672.1 PTS sugar transporter subunit IIA [Clostridium botulinum]MCD3203697.1 sigma 54-interacting transcriptional regulator [Clostridium botulinum C/D]
MKRIDKVYSYIKEKSQQYTIEDLKQKSGFSAQFIGEELGILRNNVSKDLNELARKGIVVKIKGRPVLYFEKKCIENLIHIRIEDGPVEIENLNTLIKQEEYEKKSPFDYLIGAETSLKNQIEQAKAAMLYPPNGLHTLIVGQTGVGKTLFANMMYSYGKYVGKFDEKSPFIVFNCADYYNNPQLLLSHIFGHIKGAFTGADTEKSGLVQKADGGILFLDEIHRLPPEGQEMIFYFIDTGTYNKLGETDRKRKANVFIIGATTEDPASALLKTFIRRIPIMITIPSFEERNLEDKINIIEYLLSNESHRVNKTIKISCDVIKALIGSASFGNIGQLKSNIQLICARGFLNSIKNNKEIEIDLDMLPNNIKNGLISIAAKRKEAEEISYLIPSNLTINPKIYKGFLEDDEYELPFNLYKIIEDKVAILKEEGMDDEYINKFISTDINIHIKCFYDKFKTDVKNREKILKIVDHNILEFAEEIQKLVEKMLNKKFNDRFLYALSLHLGAFFNRVDKNVNLNKVKIEGISTNNPKEYEVALQIKDKIYDKYHIEVPEVEVTYLTLLLSSIQDTQNLGHVAIIVAAHGSSTASSMVNVAQQLLGDKNIIAVDMPLEINPKEVLNYMIEKVKEIDRGRGILLLVDMGSLCSFGNIIMEKTNIPIKTIDMVSTPLVLEAVRKASVFDMELENIYNSLKQFNGYENDMHINKKIKGVIVTICSTGEGTALKLKELVEDILSNMIDESIQVIPIGMKNIKEDIEKIARENTILASVGIVNPKIDAQFISLESLIDGRGEKILRSILKGQKVDVENKDGNIIVKKLCFDTLNQVLTYLNPNKAISVLMDFITLLQEEFKTEFTNSMQVRIITHVACALERMITKDGLIYKYDKQRLDKVIIDKVIKASSIFKKGLNIELTVDEIYFIVEMFN